MRKFLTSIRMVSSRHQTMAQTRKDIPTNAGALVRMEAPRERAIGAY